GDTDTQDPTAPVTDETEGEDDGEAGLPDDDGTETMEQEPDEELDADIDEAEESDEMTLSTYAADEETGDDPEVKTIDVNITLPYYQGKSYRDWIPYLGAFSYAIGEDTEFTPVDMENQTVRQGKYTHVLKVEAGKSLRFQLAEKDNTRLKDVTLKSQYGRNQYSNPESLTAEGGVYTIEIKEQDDNWQSVQSYTIDITAVQLWHITFVDLYAGNHDNESSVAVYQKNRNNYDEAETPTDIAGQPITVDSEEWNDWYYQVTAKEGFTFDGMAAASDIRIEEANIGTNTYSLGYPDSTLTDITIFVTADRSQEKKINLHVPAEVTAAMTVAVLGKSPSDEKYKELTLENGSVAVQDDMKISVQVTSSNMAYMVQATYQEADEEATPFIDPYTTFWEGEWRRDFDFDGLNHVDGDITISLSRVSMRQVKMAVDWDAVSYIRVSTPVSDSYSGGDDAEAPTLYVPENETLKFKVDMRNNKGEACVSMEDGTELDIAGYDKDSYYGTEEPYYSIQPTSDMTISIKGKEYVYRFNYSEEDASILVYESDNRNSGPTGEPLELTDHCYRSYRDDLYLWVMVNPKADKEFAVWYNSSGNFREDVVHQEYNDRTDEDGSKYLCFGEIREWYLADKTVTIEGYNTNTVTFATENDLSFRRMEYEPDGDYFNELDWIDGSITVREGEDLYFRTSRYDEKYRLRISMTGTALSSLTSRWEDPDMQNYLVYHLVPTADTTITFALEERKQYEVTFEKGDGVKSFESYYDEEDVVVGKTYRVYEDDYIVISDIIATGTPEEAAKKQGKVTYQIGGETYEVSPEYDWENSISDPMYRIKVTDNMTIMIDVQDIAQHTLTFKEYEQLENIHVWKLGTYKEKDNLYRTDNGTVTLDDNGFYYFDFQLKDGVGLESVALKDSAGNEKILARAYLDEDDGEMGYRLGALQGSMEIIPTLVSGYTVKFDLSKLSAEEAAKITIDDSKRQETIIGQNKNQENIGAGKISAAATESASFLLEDWRYYKLTSDSERFTLTKVLGDDGDYVYVISPKQTTGLPEVVTISLEKYAEHAATLEYSDEIRSISLSDLYGYGYKLVENETRVYRVYGEGVVLSARAIDGYSPVVKIKGTAEGAEATELDPYRIYSSGAAEYHLGELTEDKIIQVTVTRATQKKTYQYGFLSEGGQVTVKDTAYDTVYDVWINQEDYKANYSVQKGGKISFYVEPALGFELTGVYANDQKIESVRDAASQREIYEVTPTADTQIRIDVAKIVTKYPLTFSWSNTDAVKAVKVQGYELQNNRIDVEAGTKISFLVELTDTKYSVKSVTMNGQEVPYYAGEGLYTLTTVEAPMNVEINADVADKVVKFSNTLENAELVVETNELIRHRNDTTYLASGNAELLKFKVNVTDKAQKVSVTYVNQQGVKSVLKEKEQTEQGEQGVSYSYEIAVAQLPLNSEITISGELPAGDKTELEKAVSQYEGYQKSDYTEDSWTAFENALKEAEECMKKEDATQEEIDAALGALTGAASKLVKKGDDPAPPTPVEPKEGLWFEIMGNEDTADGSYVYTGAAIKPDIRVYNGNTLLEVKKDYTVAYKNNTNAGTATITVTGKGNFKSKATAEFTINKKNIGDEDITIPEEVSALISSKGKVTNPKVTVKFGKKTLKSGTDYKVVYPTDAEIVKDADGKVVAQKCSITISTEKVKNNKGTLVDSVNYTGEKTISYVILGSTTKLMSKATIKLEKTKVDYANDSAGGLGKGTEQPAVASIKIGGKVVYDKADPSRGEVQDLLASFDVDYDNWDQAGKATVTLTAKDDRYYGSKSVTYTVNGTKLAASVLDITGISTTGYEYTGEPIYINDEAADPSKRMKVTNKKTGEPMKEGTDYTVSYKTGKKLGEHTNAGTVTVTITGVNAYTGSVSKTFKITPVDLATFQGTNVPAERQFTADISAKYTKTGAKPAITALAFNGVDLVEKQDYTVSYSKNTKVDKGNRSATMTVKGKGNFKGQIKHTYEVTTASEEDVYATAVDIQQPTKLSQVKSTVKVYETSTGKALKAGTDYDKTVAYYSDAACTTPITEENFATAAAIDQRIYAKVTMKGNYAGTGETPGSVTTSFRV
ncbi:MAG: hypothetical protein NC548_45965, partial [Lachnospiraceae bacterium]|nr:hypothetical protein [Lachnospiraceae bacterium]